jgi:hypothetical protein
MSLDLGALAVAGGIHILSNPVLTTLDLGSLTHMEFGYPFPGWSAGLTISDNATLATLDFGAFESLVGPLVISGNPALTTLDGLGSLAWLGGGPHGGLTIQDNVHLPQCEACDLLDQLVDFGGSFDFHDNLADTCNNSCT